ncbi:MAG: hypothetical protein CL489_07950 [Acidobacteria bacterium]|nr:hypothetical protein [Acidobacteriota bacterium]
MSILKTGITPSSFAVNCVDVYIDTFMFQGHVNYSYQAYIGKDRFSQQHVLDCGWHKTKHELETALNQICLLLADREPSFIYNKGLAFRTWGNYVREMHKKTRNGTRKLADSQIDNIRAIGSLNTEFNLLPEIDWCRPESYRVIQHRTMGQIFYAMKCLTTLRVTIGYDFHILRKLGKEWITFDIKRKPNDNWKQLQSHQEESRIRRIIYKEAS